MLHLTQLKVTPYRHANNKNDDSSEAGEHPSLDRGGEKPKNLYHLNVTPIGDTTDRTLPLLFTDPSVAQRRRGYLGEMPPGGGYPLAAL